MRASVPFALHRPLDGDAGYVSLLQAALFLNKGRVCQAMYKLRMARYRVMPSIQEGDDENYEELTFPALFGGLITMVQRLGTSGELEIRLLKGEDILRACKEFFDEDQTGRSRNCHLSP